jgi:hypothetical protein
MWYPLFLGEMVNNFVAVLCLFNLIKLFDSTNVGYYCVSG